MVKVRLYYMYTFSKSNAKRFDSVLKQNRGKNEYKD